MDDDRMSGFTLHISFPFTRDDYSFCNDHNNNEEGRGGGDGEREGGRDEEEKVKRNGGEILRFRQVFYAPQGHRPSGRWGFDRQLSLRSPPHPSWPSCLS